MGLGDVTNSVIPKPVLVSEGDQADSIVSRYFTPHKCHMSHAVTGAIGVVTAFAMPGTVASGITRKAGRHPLSVVHPQGQIDLEVELTGEGVNLNVVRAALVRTARKIMQGELHLPQYVFPSPSSEKLKRRNWQTTTHSTRSRSLYPPVREVATTPWHASSRAKLAPCWAMW